MKKLILVILLISSSIAYEKVFIDTHGGKTDSIVKEKNSFSNVLSSLLSKKKEKNTVESNQIKIDKIEKIDDFNKDNK